MSTKHSQLTYFLVRDWTPSPKTGNKVRMFSPTTLFHTLLKDPSNITGQEKDKKNHTDWKGIIQHLLTYDMIIHLFM